MDDEDDVQGLGYVGRLVGPNLETPGVTGDGGDVTFGHPGDAIESQTRCISTGVVAPGSCGPGRGDGTGADEDEVAGADTQPCVLLRSLQVSRSDGVARLEPIDSEGTGQIEQDSPADHATETALATSPLRAPLLETHSAP